MQVRSLKGTRCHKAVLSCLGAATWLCAMAPFPAAAQQKADGADLSADLRPAPKQPPTILATPPFTVAMTQLAGCFVVNIGSTPQDVTVIARTDDGSPPVRATFPVAPNTVSGSEAYINASQPVQLSCEFQSSDVTLIRGSVAVFEAFSNHPVLQIIPAN
ncbi:hypothetical protein J7E62_24010 [Variovorax paradoxus]|nr:hypothetical protein [Variovorax paradoxus]